jgi:hypothetical protein
VAAADRSGTAPCPGLTFAASSVTSIPPEVLTTGLFGDEYQATLRCPASTRAYALTRDTLTEAVGTVLIQGTFLQGNANPPDRNLENTLMATLSSRAREDSTA